MRKALFLDRDGVINLDKKYVHKIEDFEPIEKNLKLIKEIVSKDDYLIFIITNQAGIARGYYTEEEYLKFQKYVEEYLLENGIKIKKTYYCPHHPEGIIDRYKITCECRKPKPGMLLQAAKEYEIDLKKSVLIGDKDSDFAAGTSVGCEIIRV